MNMFFLLKLLCILLFVGGCGGKKNNKGERIVRIPEEQVLEIMANQSFDCASIGNDGCPHGVSRLFIINAADINKSAVCSGFMVSPTNLVTNHHCVSNQSKCVNTFIAVYQGSTYLSTRCRRLIRGDEDYPDINDPRRAIDYALLEIEDKYEGEVFLPAAGRAENGEIITAWVIDHTGLDRAEGNLFESRVTEFRCKVDTQNARASLVLKNCPVVHGNSGSPLLNGANKIVGVIWGGTAVFGSSLNLYVRRSLNELATATETIHFGDIIP